MARLRRDTHDALASTPYSRPIRVVACGTLFLTHTLTLPSHPEPSAVIRAHSVSRSRGGSASTCLSILAQFPAVDAILVAPLGGNEEGRMIIRDLEQEKVTTRYCKVWDHAGVPSAWVLHADDTGTHTVINNNPLPDITHEEFISLLGPVLVPENYAYLNASPSSPPPSGAIGSSGSSPNLPRPSMSNPSSPGVRTPNNSPAPLDWIHFEGRSVKTTLSNIVGLDGLAKERKWRSHCVFSLDVGRRARQGIEALIPHVDVIFLNKHYARAHSPHYAASPRAFLLSLTPVAPPHALLVAHWGTDGAAVLSVPTREYFQSSGWVDNTITPSAPTSPTPAPLQPNSRPGESRQGEVQSVRSGSDFWAVGHHTESSSEFTAGLQSSSDPSSPIPSRVLPQQGGHTRRRPHRSGHIDSDSSDSEGTQIAGPRGGNNSRSNTSASTQNQSNGIDEIGAQDAFVAGMMFALSRRMLPGEPYTPSAVIKEGNTVTVRGVEADGQRDRGRWRLEECLRFATELAGRKARRKGWDGLADEMTKAGWFDT